MAPTPSAPEDSAPGAAKPAAADPSLILPQVSGRHHSLDGIRAGACLMVLVLHVSTETGDALSPGPIGALVTSGALAVPLFFALSGVLLYRPWARAALDGDKGPDTRAYLVRRMMRVLPAYWVVAITALVLWAGDQLGSLRHWFEVLTLTFTFNTDPDWEGTGPHGLGQIWSLSVEVAFYLSLPVFAFVLSLWAKRGRTVDVRGRRLITGLAVITVLAFLALIPQYFPEPREYMHSWLPRCMGMFAVGMALAVLSEWAWREKGPDGPVRRFCRTIAASPGLCWLVAAAFFVLEATPAAGGRFFEPGNLWISLVESATSIGFAFFVVAPAALSPRAPDSPPPSLRTGAAWRNGAWLDALMRHRVMLFLAKITYGIFLWQFVVLYLWRDFTGQEVFTGSFWLDIVPVTIGTILLSVITFHWVEEPARKWSRGLFSQSRPDREKQKKKSGRRNGRGGGTESTKASATATDNAEKKTKDEDTAAGTR